MRIPTVEKCCCNCNLRLGSAIIGVLFLLSSLIQTISFSVQASNTSTAEDGDKGTYIVSAIIAALMLVSTGLLLLGVHRERQGLLKPWLLLFAVLAGIFVLVMGIGAIVCFATAAPAAGAILLIMGLIYFGVYGYCLVVVYSFYLSLSGVTPGTV